MYRKHYRCVETRGHSTSLSAVPIVGYAGQTQYKQVEAAPICSQPADTRPVGDTFVKPQSGTPLCVEDFTSNAITTKVRIGGGACVDAVMSRPLGDFRFVVIAAENDDVLTGQGKGDRLYDGQAMMTCRRMT